MRINYNFSYYYNRLSPRQKARMAAEAKFQSFENRMERAAASILKIKASSLSQSETIETKKETGLEQNL